MLTGSDAGSTAGRRSDSDPTAEACVAGTRQPSPHLVASGSRSEGGFGLVFTSSTVVRLLHLPTILGVIPNSRLSDASEACDRCIAARTACVVVALP